MKFVRASRAQIQAIKNLCFNRSNIYLVYKTLERLGKDTLYQLSIGDAKDMISALINKRGSQ
ncbi:MAG: hypothetical protein ACYDAZ_01850 [Thermoplasmataceae archaeon]